MIRIYAIAATEIRIQLRNRWIATSVLLMTAFSLLIAFVGSTPSGSVGAPPLTATSASLATLTVYLVPLVALLMSYDAFAGEHERGTLPLLLTYPVARWEILAGKFAAQLIILSLAVFIGFGLSAIFVVATGGSTHGLSHILRLSLSACLLGAGFLAIGNCISAATQDTGKAAAVSIALWIFAVVMYDVALLGALVTYDGSWFATSVFPWLLVSSPTDAFRLFNLSQIEATAVAGGIATASRTLAISSQIALISLFAWPAAALSLAGWYLRRFQP